MQWYNRTVKWQPRKFIKTLHVIKNTIEENNLHRSKKLIDVDKKLWLENIIRSNKKFTSHDDLIDKLYKYTRFYVHYVNIIRRQIQKYINV